MLIFNPRRIFAQRGIERASGMLVKNGLAPSTATRFLQAQTSLIKIEYIEKVCVLMHCTPSDLFDWKPDAKNILPENHPLKVLERSEKIINIRELLSDLPVEKLSQVETLVNDLKNG
ncbi:hypothetical protein BH10ACI1_BH10ACI1_34140 [soil metagenome]